jgi:hypothetical protein
LQVGCAPPGAAREPDQAYVPLKAGEVLGVHRDDGANTGNEHRRDQVRVVNLLAPA